MFEEEKIIGTVIVNAEMVEVITNREDFDYDEKVANEDGTVTLTWRIPYLVSDDTDDYFDYVQTWKGKEIIGTPEEEFDWHNGVWWHSVSVGDKVNLIEG